MVAMAEMTWIAGPVALSVAGFVSLYALWHRRAHPSLQRVPVRDERTVDIVRARIELDDRAR
jgi:hypothetical protein